MSQKIGVSPSSLLSISDDYSSFCLDEVVIHFGEWIEAKINEVDVKSEASRKAAVENIIRKCIGLEQKFRSIG